VNTRTDHYGGANLDNRSRIVFEIIEAIKARVTDPSCEASSWTLSSSS
jgi:2,4-dienoyl-CoA reductase-like NADH-dependent reductase (Old Yellow Enzyme family)